MSRGIVPDQGSNLCLLHWQSDFLWLNHREALFYYLNITQSNIFKFPCFSKYKNGTETFIFDCWNHSCCPFRNAQPQTVQNHSYSLWPVHLQRRLDLGMENQSHPPMVFPCFLDMLRSSCVSHIIPELKSHTGMSVLCFLWWQHHCFLEAVLVQGYFSNFDLIRFLLTMILSTFVFSCPRAIIPFMLDPQDYNCS